MTTATIWRVTSQRGMVYFRSLNEALQHILSAVGPAETLTDADGNTVASITPDLLGQVQNWGGRDFYLWSANGGYNGGDARGSIRLDAVTLN